jgi:hypothetical protein
LIKGEEACKVLLIPVLPNSSGQPDEFRVYFGGSDAVVGSAIVQITRTGSPCNP